MDAPVQFGRYKLIRRIGAGGMGEVFLATEESGPAPRVCVVKKILPNLVQNRAFVGRFLDESKVVVRLKHPNVARVYAMGEVKGEYFLAMEYVQGKTVSRFARRLREEKQVMPLGLILLLGERVCQGLAYAHDVKDDHGEPLHLVHRDLSPANVCVSYRGDVKIIDFGAAHSTLKEEQTAPRVVIGNLTYMSPEQARKQLVDRRADVYSTGVMLWELLAWHALPQKGDPIERWRRAANPSWDKPSRHRTNLPAELDEVVLRAVQREPKSRFPDAASLGAELSRLRKKFAPDASERDLGALLALTFKQEKTEEDAALREALEGGGRSRRKRLAVVPPTALAFEHQALSAPGLPELEETTDPSGGGTPTPIAPPSAEQTRVGFGVPFGRRTTEPELEQAVLDEIEAVESGREGEEESHTAPYDTSRRLRGALLYAGIFLFATGLGFAGVWLWISRQ